MRLLPKRGRYDGPVVFVDGWHYPADKPGNPRFRLVRVDPDFEARHALIADTDRDYAGRIADQAAQDEHDAIADTGWWEFHRPKDHGDQDHRARFHRREAALDAGERP